MCPPAAPVNARTLDSPNLRSRFSPARLRHGAMRSGRRAPCSARDEDVAGSKRRGGDPPRDEGSGAACRITSVTGSCSTDQVAPGRRPVKRRDSRRCL
ncbi:hypothetical protein FA95DRAFT_1564278 [Auriscalpium vulgare]|uniref:Uncharacterized protein n=1 Tax=Auriscalpium vulgare TaxID=40419 RepID=A0ACB8RE92_9AGAM|nr:hypothetical protein FA95DRAFT_1564278 [Auriscalpium vulgare]